MDQRRTASQTYLAFEGDKEMADALMFPPTSENAALLRMFPDLNNTSAEVESMLVLGSASEEQLLLSQESVSNTSVLTGLQKRRARFSANQEDNSLQKLAEETQLSGPGQSYPRDLVVLDIGGTVFKTTKSTLCKFNESMLAALVRNQADARSGSNCPIFVDRDGGRFKDVLNYLRNGTVHSEDVSLLRGLQEEAAFYGLQALQTLLEEKIDEVVKRETKKEKEREKVEEVFSMLTKLISQLAESDSSRRSKLRKMEDNSWEPMPLEFDNDF